MSERNLTQLEDANHCGTCTAVASHSTTDAVQQPDGSWKESPNRFGCLEHKAEPMVIFTDGTKMPFKDYHVN